MKEFCDVRAIMEVQIDDPVTRDFQQIGIVRVERVGEIIFSIGSQAFRWPNRHVIANAGSQFIRRDSRDPISGTIENRRLGSGAELLDILGVNLVIVSVSKPRFPSWIEEPLAGDIDAAMFGAWRIEGVAQQGRWPQANCEMSSLWKNS